MGSPNCHVGQYSRVKIVKYRVKNPAPGEAEKDTDFCFFLNFSETMCSGKPYPSFSQAFLALKFIEDEFIDYLHKTKEEEITETASNEILNNFKKESISSTQKKAGVVQDVGIDYDAEEAVEQAEDELNGKGSTQNSNASNAPTQTKKSKP